MESDFFSRRIWNEIENNKNRIRLQSISFLSKIMRSQLLHDPSPPAHRALSFSTTHHVSMLARGPSFDGLLAPSAPCPPTPSASAAAHKIRRRENSLSCLYSQHSHALGQTLAATPLQRPPPPRRFALLSATPSVEVRLVSTSHSLRPRPPEL